MTLTVFAHMLLSITIDFTTSIGLAAFQLHLRCCLSLRCLLAGSEVSVSPVMGQGFRMERAPAADNPTCLLFATGSGISPIKALIESDELQVSFDNDVHMSVWLYVPDCL